MKEGYYSFLATCGHQGEHEYYLTQCLLRLIPRLFLFDETEVPSALLQVRSLDSSKVDEIARYLTTRSGDYVMAPLVAAVDCEAIFEPVVEGLQEIGYLQIPLTARMIIHDGQHRRAAIRRALDVHPSIGDDTVPLMILPDKELDRSSHLYNELNYAQNFLSMLFKKTEDRHIPKDALTKVLDVLFILHADHEQNCSTNAVRGVGSSDVDPYSAVAAGVAALYGPLHGGANEAVLRMLRRIDKVENIPDFLARVKDREEKLMGFGHRVYKNYDPRARIIQGYLDPIFEATEYNPLVEIARELEKRALDDEYFTSRKLYPNVDFYSGIIYEALEIPTDMFTVIFAIPRTAGWVAQWMEMHEDSEQKIARPRQIYTGERERKYVPVADREGPEKIIGPPARRPKRPRRGA